MAWEGENEPTIDRVVERLYINYTILDDFIMDPKNQREKGGVLFAKKMKYNIERQFPGKGTDCEIYCRANYLNPVFKGIRLMDEERLEEVKQGMEEEWQKNGRRLLNTNSLRPLVMVKCPLRSVARSVLANPASSAKSERAFSKGGNN